jgi:protein tyrosine phosphatase (PTP) superfamily phosphohydrolase (DUF442 family)
MTKLTEIYNYLPLSSNLLTSGQPLKEQFAAIAGVGVEAVINLALPTSANAIPNEDEIVTALGMKYFHIPVVWDSPAKSALEKFMEVMESLKDKKVLIHCAANMRVPTFVALYRIICLGWDHDKAFKDVYRIWNPYEDENWRKFITSVLKAKAKK